VLTDFNLRIRRGECIALVGETGGGKEHGCETALPLLRADGQAVFASMAWTIGREVFTGLQSSLGIVLQEPHLFQRHDSRKHPVRTV